MQPEELTLNHLFQHGVRNHARPDMFRVRRDGRYVGVSSLQADRAVRELSAALVASGIQPGDSVALLSENRLEWALADLAILGARGVVVPLYPTLLPDQIREQLADCRATWVLCSNAEQLAKIARIRGDLPSLRHVVAFDAADTAEASASFAALRRLGSLELQRGKDGYDDRMGAVAPDDVATILYTSGTTGIPKGVMLTHRNIVFNVLTGLQALDVSEADGCLSFLPLSHILERTAGHYAMLYAGVSIAYAESVDRVAQNMLESRPTVMVAVPRLFEKIDAALLARASSTWLARRIFLWSRAKGILYAQRRIAGQPVGLGLRWRMRVADALVFRKLRARTGGRLRFFLSGGAPLPKALAEFFFAAGMPILEGYGLTETSPVISVNTFRDYRPGTVGKPVAGVEVRIAADGEILTRSPSVMKGYHNDPELTAGVLCDGWFHTGDIGEFDDDGFLRITDRKKDLIVTSGGKNIAPQPIENRLRADPLIDQAALIGDGRKYIVALIVPHFPNLQAWARHRKLDFDDVRALAGKPEVERRLWRTIARENAQRPSYEQIKRFAILQREFTQENGELTPTLKVKRREIEARYAERIEALYAET